jgi:hypothetical protein
LAKEPRDREKSERLVLKIAKNTDEPLDRSEYEYIIRDLKRVAILALFMFALLFVLAVIMR